MKNAIKIVLWMAWLVAMVYAFVVMLAVRFFYGFWPAAAIGTIIIVVNVVIIWVLINKGGEYVD